MISQSSVITIILPVYNGAETLERAIDSILNQTYQNWRLIIIDDGSTDNSLQILHKYNDARINVISGKLHLGIAKRLNQAIEMCRTKYIARMDADDVAYPERLEKQIAFLQANPDIDLVGTSVRLIDKKGRPIGKRIFPKSHSQIIAYPWLNTILIIHPTWCGRAEWFRKWQYRNFKNTEDQELLFRSRHQSRFANLEEVLLDYQYNTYSLKRQISTHLEWIKILYLNYGKRGRVVTLLIGTIIAFAKILRDFFRGYSIK
jgi:glycosyltransferase involved in cell wall biosynthesis